MCKICKLQVYIVGKYIRRCHHTESLGRVLACTTLFGGWGGGGWSREHNTNILVVKLIKVLSFVTSLVAKIISGSDLV